MGILQRMGLEEIRCDYVTVDTLRCRADMIDIWRAWAEAYTASIAAHTHMGIDEVRAHWADMARTLHDPEGYAVWHVPVLSGRKP